MSVLQNFGTGSGGTAFAQVFLSATANYTQEATGTLIDYTLSNNNSPATVQAITLTTGNNTINSTNCPAIANAGGVWIVPGPANGSALILKGATGDTGIPLNLTCPAFIPFLVSPPTSFVLNSASGGAITLIWV